MHVEVSLALEIEASASISEMEHQIQAAGQQAMRQAMKQAVRQWEDQHQSCPHCGQKPHRLEGTVRRTIATTFGRVHIPRRRFRCQKCGRRWCPATQLFAPLAGGTMSAPLQEAAMLAGCSWPYRVAARQLQRLCGADISAEEIRLLTNQHGKQRAQEQQAEAEQARSAPAVAASSASQVEQPLLVGIDGGWVCSREQRGGMEGKVAVICSQMEDLPMREIERTFSWSKRGAPRRPPRQRHRLVKRRFVATFGPSKQLGHLAKAAAGALESDAARPVVVIGDGAQWIKTEQGRHFPQATCILDWAHLWREARHALVSAQCHRCRCFAHRSAQRRLDYTSAVAGLPLNQPWVFGRTEEYCQAVVPVQAVFERAYREERQNESTLVRENSMPVGSAEIIYGNF